ncbi:MFS transporter [Patulibacter sp. SYSU D01012]|uniref:MFS transporter n=1 Tax=Patulibacter sp. SYSU D01012 TaxID=2817381 RepID=UPI001B3145F4
MPDALSLPPDPAAARARRLVLGAILLAVLVVPMSISGTAVALPRIGADTGADVAALQWVVNAFNVTFAAFTLAWGAAADVVGRRRAFAAGAAIYAGASVLSALAREVLLLDVARALAGIGAAAIFSCGSAILASLFSGPERVRAFALFGTVAGLGLGVGPTASGLLVDGPGWPAIFALHALALGVVLLAVPLVPADRGGARAGATIDVPGTAAFVVALLALTMAIAQASQWGWTSPGVLLLTALAAVVLAVFVALERRRAHPMLELDLLRDRRLLGLCLVPVAGAVGFVTLLTFLPSYLTAARGASSGAAGLTMLLLTVPVLVCPVLAGRLVGRGASPDAVILASLVALVAGTASLTVIGPDVPLGVVVVPMLLVGAGMGLGAGLVDGQALERVAPEKAGMAAGLLNTLRLGGEAVAVAVYGALLATFLRGALDDDLGRFGIAGARADGLVETVASGDAAAPARLAPPALREELAGTLAAGYDTAFHEVLWVLTGIGLVLALVIWWLVRRPAPAAEAAGVPDGACEAA